jgi:peptidyl-prolyl cis-trans isomerase C
MSVQYLRDPLVHFFLIGALLFSAYHWLEKPGENVKENRNQILINQADLDHLTSLWKLQWKREPAPHDVEAIIDRYLRQEVFYREALKMNLDHNDEIIKRRLAQKMEAVANDLSTLMKPPTEERLRDYYHSREDFFTLPRAYALKQVLFLSDEPAEHIESTLESLRQGEPIASDRKNKLSLPEEFSLTSVNDLHNAFGGDFVDSLDKLPVGEWAGPVQSGYGRHLVFIEDKQEPQLPAFEDVRDYVAREYEYQSVLDSQDQVYENLLAKYEVVITADIPPATIKNGLANN